MRRRAVAVLGLGLLMIAGSAGMIGWQALGGGKGAVTLSLLPVWRDAGSRQVPARIPAVIPAASAAPAPGMVEAPPLPDDRAGDRGDGMPRPPVRRGAEGAAAGFACTLEGGARRCRAGG